MNEMRKEISTDTSFILLQVEILTSRWLNYNRNIPLVCNIKLEKKKASE